MEVDILTLIAGMVLGFILGAGSTLWLIGGRLVKFLDQVREAAMPLMKAFSGGTASGAPKNLWGVIGLALQNPAIIGELIKGIRK